MKKNIISGISGVLDELPLGPKNKKFLSRRAKANLQKREKAKQDQELLRLKSTPPPDYIQSIRQKRIQLKITQFQLAHNLNTHQSVISKLENGQGHHTLSFLTKVCSKLGLKISINIK